MPSVRGGAGLGSGALCSLVSVDTYTARSAGPRRSMASAVSDSARATSALSSHGRQVPLALSAVRAIPHAGHVSAHLGSQWRRLTPMRDAFWRTASLDLRSALATSRLGMVPELAEVCKAQSKPLNAQIKLETGMHRIGVEPGEELAALIGELKAAQEWVHVTGAFSHFAWPGNAEVCEAQYKKLLAGAEQLKAAGIPVPMCHISASESSELFPQYALDAVRIGRRLYMDHPKKPLGNIQEVVSWRSYLTNVKQRHAGDSLAYFGKYVLDKDTVVATVGVGYGDGLNEKLVACHAPVLVGGKRCPLLACCMDQCFVDVTGVEDAKVGDEIAFFGYDSDGNFLSSQETANLIGDDEGCGLTSALMHRVARVFH